jgi:hypothetical protein
MPPTRRPGAPCRRVMGAARPREQGVRLVDTSGHGTRALHDRLLIGGEFRWRPPLRHGARRGLTSTVIEAPCGLVGAPGP